MALLPIILFYLPVISGLCVRLKRMVSFYFRESNEISKCADFSINIWPPVEALKKDAEETRPVALSLVDYTVD